ncbi:MAG TPA: GntR family transcriptional regulator [Solirubrobacterales bacterium]|jgi:DNA-binding transcriptional regulator YhcF (GntR family)|nr:GntR family transcriptional regulator [Solirubrobacterales bacterium]
MAQQVPPVLDAAPFRADPDDEIPVGLQLAWRLRALIASGRLLPGDRLPSVRVLADWSAVNVNTVRSVYSKLEDDGLVVTHHGLGTFVGARAAPSPELERIAWDALERAREAGLDPRDLAVVAMVCADLPAGLDEQALPPDAVPEAPEPDPVAPSDTGAVRRDLREQIARLEAELGSYQHELPRRAPPSGRGEVAHLPGVAELEETRDALLGRLAEAREEASRSDRRRGAARARLDAMVADPAGRKWDVVSAAELGEPGCTTYSVAPAAGPLGALMRWWRVKVSSGCPLSRAG